VSGIPPALSAALAERYLIQRELGQGGMATVYLSEDLKHHRKVAIKVLRPELAAVLGAERFLAEIRTTANLQHAHILPLFDSGLVSIPGVPGDPAGRPYYVMPYVEGETLRDRLTREKQLPIADALRIATEVAGALDHAHRRGVIHRDIKPENILLQEGQALVADFGIALATAQAGGSRMTETGMSLGTPSYMSPEQAMAEPMIDGRTDIYALGCVLYEMLLGEPPFTGATAQAIVAKALTTEAPSLSSLRRTVPPSVDQAVHRALERTPADRFPTAAAFAEALAAGDSAVAAPGKAAPRFAIPAGVALVLALAAFLVLRHRGPAGAAASPGNQRTIAVLPFRNISRDAAQEYFSAGMTEEIATQLSRVGALKVLGRSATAPYEGKSDRLQRMAADLNVGSVVEGSVRLAGNMVRIGVELTDAHTGQSLWAETYDRRIDDVFAVQGDVAKKVSFALQAALTPAESTRVGHVATRDPEAYKLYLRALEQNPVLRAGNTAGTGLLRQAIQRDPDFALAYATLARTYLFRGLAGEPAWIDSGLVAARRAVTLDSTEPEGWFALGDALVTPGKFSEARRAYLKALELRPGHSGAMVDLADIYVALGRFDEALDLSLRAQEVNPTNPAGWYHVGLPLLALDDNAAAERYLLAGDRKLPGQPRTLGLLVWLDLRRGKPQQATERARRLADNNPDNTEMPPMRAELATAIADPEALALIEPLARQDPESQGQMLTESLRSMYALALQRAGKPAEAKTLWAESAEVAQRNLEEGHEGYAAPMELSAIHAIQGDGAAALDWLEKGYRAGFKDYVILELDPFFASLRQEARYRAVVALMKQDVAEMRARAAKAHPEIFLVHDNE
jgi:eukaryotic-like serine/threonine-protein kinase